MSAAANLIGNALFGKTSSAARPTPTAPPPRASSAALAERTRRSLSDREGLDSTILTGRLGTPTQRAGAPLNAPGSRVGGTTLLGGSPG